MKILVLNGPNLNSLGKRDKKHYGSMRLSDINIMLKKIATQHNCELVFFQSNHEGALIDFLQKEAEGANGILINPGALTHYGYSLRDALADINLPIVEIHLSDIAKREDFRKIDVLADVVITRVMGMREKSYTEGLKKLIAYIKK